MSFSWRLCLGLRRDRKHVKNDDGSPVDYVPHAHPVWTEASPAPDERFILHSYSDPDDTSSNPFFDKRNIQATIAALKTV